MLSAVYRRLGRRRPAHHQAGAGHNTTSMRFDDAQVDAVALAKIIRIDDQISLRSHRSESQVDDDVGQYGFRPEVLFSDATGRTAVPIVVSLDGLESCDNILHGVERKQTLASGKDGTEPSVLGDHWTTRSKVAGAAFAEPATAQTHVLVFGDSEFAARGPYILSIGPRIGGEGLGVGQ